MDAPTICLVPDLASPVLSELPPLSRLRLMPRLSKSFRDKFYDTKHLRSWMERLLTDLVASAEMRLDSERNRERIWISFRVSPKKSYCFFVATEEVESLSDNVTKRLVAGLYVAYVARHSAKVCRCVGEVLLAMGVRAMPGLPHMRRLSLATVPRSLAEAQPAGSRSIALADAVEALSGYLADLLGLQYGRLVSEAERLRELIATVGCDEEAEWYGSTDGRDCIGRRLLAVEVAAEEARERWESIGAL
jgi:hypothetical protein